MATNSSDNQKVEINTQFVLSILSTVCNSTATYFGTKKLISWGYHGSMWLGDRWHYDSQQHVKLANLKHIFCQKLHDKLNDKGSFSSFIGNLLCRTLSESNEQQNEIQTLDINTLIGSLLQY